MQSKECNTVEENILFLPEFESLLIFLLQRSQLYKLDPQKISGQVSWSDKSNNQM